MLLNSKAIDFVSYLHIKVRIEDFFFFFFYPFPLKMKCHYSFIYQVMSVMTPLFIFLEF